MERFLNLVAKDLLQRYGNDLSRVALVFPNKRAGLFFNQALAQLSDGPVWAPSYLSISSLFGSLSALQLADSIQLVCELYKVYQQVTGRSETLDDFYFWGEMLISDFDDVDKNLVDARQLFANLNDWKAILAGVDYLDEEQEAAVRQFFQNFSMEKRTEIKERFLSLWDVLFEIYSKFRLQLEDKQIAYEGMLYRDALAHLDSGQLPYDVYAFVGFNVLNKVEKQLFTSLNNAGKALFYWDYDEFYLKENHEAGEFIRRNMVDFPQALEGCRFDAFAKPKQVQIIGAPTENAQARFAGEWVKTALRRTGDDIKPQECAVVLCNEALLQPVLHSLPPQDSVVNVTMGFPLVQTPVYSFLSALLQVQADYKAASGRFAYRSVIALLKHPFTCRLSEKAGELQRKFIVDNEFYPAPADFSVCPHLASLFVPVKGNLGLCDYLLCALKEVAVLFKDTSAGQGENQLYSESVFKSYTVVSRFRTLIDSGALTITTLTFRRLLDRVLAGTSIPFHGEPAIGLQVMGVLETRNLDFRRLVMLSVNEGLLPQKEGESSFVPYNLRKAYGMTTIEHKNSVYAYYFYRLLQRAEEVTLLYNTSMDGLNKGERSRFLLQYLIESPHSPSQAMLQANQNVVKVEPLSVVKTPDIMEKLLRRFEHTARTKNVCFTPSALNAYIDCPLKFYYKYIAQLKAPDEVSMEIDSALFGSIFHRAAELLYGELTGHGKLIRAEDLKKMLNDKARLSHFVDRSINELFFHTKPDAKSEYNGVQLINASVIVLYLQRLLQRDCEYAPFVLEQTEYAASLEIDVPLVGGGSLHTSIGGIIDRMDSKDGTLRIVDYKTGGNPKGCESLASLFVQSEKRDSYAFQAFLYAYVMQHKLGESVVSAGLQQVAPSLLYIHKNISPFIQIGKRTGKTTVENIAHYADDFRENLNQLIAEIFHPDMPFEQTKVENKCSYCDFKELCGKK